MNKGNIVQVIGPVVDVEFPDGKGLPKIYNALEIEYEVHGQSTKLGESFNSKSANSSRFVRAINCLAFFPVTIKLVLAGSKFVASRKRFVFNAPQSPLSVLIINTNSFWSGRMARSG